MISMPVDIIGVNYQQQILQHSKVVVQLHHHQDNPPPTNQPGNIDRFGIKMIYPTKTDGQTWFQNNDPDNDGRLVSDEEVITRVGDYFVSTLQSNGTAYLRVLTEFGDLGLSNCTENYADLDATGNVFRTEDFKNVEITILVYPQEHAPNAPTNDSFSVEARSGTWW